jgi:hypothetical protein
LLVRYARTGTHRLLERTLTAFHGVSHPSTLAEASSDLHRDYLSRLCCAFRLSQPLDALFRPQPLRPCFRPVTPLGFRLQRFSLPGSGLRLSAGPSLRAVLKRLGLASARTALYPAPTSRVHASRESVPSGRSYPVPGGRSSPGFHLSEVYPNAALASCFHEASSHGLSTTLNGCPLVVVFTLQSIKEPRGGRVSFEAHQPP